MPSPNETVLWIDGGRVIDPSSGRDAVEPIYVVGDTLVSSLEKAQEERAQRIDASGLVVCPGLVDIHVHLREPGQTHKEDIGSGSQAAAAGGFTSIVCMPNTSPPVDSVGILQQVYKAIDEKAVVNVFPTACITMGMAGEQLAPIGSLYEAGVAAITDDGHCVQNNELMRRALEYAHMFGLCVMDHCQEYTLTERAVMNEGEWSVRLGLEGWPCAAEDLIVARNIILAAYTKAHIHMQHISSAKAVDMIRQAKREGLPVTAEATPHHMYFTDAYLKDYDTHYKVNPPLRTEADRQCIIEGLLDGTLDCIATDHAPHSDYEKAQEFDCAPFGMIGLETALASSLETLYHGKRCDLAYVVDCLTRKSAGVLKLDKGTLKPGAKADITLFDPDEAWTVQADSFHSRSTNSPWLGHTLHGRVKKTFVSGQMVFDSAGGGSAQQ